MPLFAEQVLNHLFYFAQNQRRSCNSHYRITDKRLQRRGPREFICCAAAARDVCLHPSRRAFHYSGHVEDLFLSFVAFCKSTHAPKCQHLGIFFPVQAFYTKYFDY